MIEDKYSTIYNSLGKPIGLKQIDNNNGYIFQRYQNGIIYLIDNNNAIAIYGDIYNKWKNLIPNIGFPLDDPQYENNILTQRFENGIIYLMNNNYAIPIYGNIYDRWNNILENGIQIGYPLTLQNTLPDGSGYYQEFQRGYIYTH